MATVLDPDLRQAASHRHMIEHLTAPLGAGAVEAEVAIDSTAKGSVDWTTRRPLLLVAPVAPLDAGRLLLTATVPGPTAGTVQVRLEWAPYTEAGAFLPLWWPAFDATVTQRPPFSVQLSLKEVSAAGTQTQVTAAQVKNRLALRLVDGITGQVLYLLAAEKQRLRRTGRELAGMPLLSRARDHALDSLGAELGVPRFADRLKYQAGAIVSQTAREADDDYRRRLELYHGTFMRSRNRLLELLNGPGPAASPNAAAIGELAAAIPTTRRATYQNRFELEDRNNDFAVAIHIVAAGNAALRQHFFQFIRAAHLILPLTSDSAVHAKRFLPKGRVDREERLRKSIRSGFDFASFEAGSSPALAPMLAYALVRAGRCIKALDGPAPWPMFRAQRSDRGSRYELGLGADLKRLTAAELNAMAAKHATLKAANPKFAQVADPDPTDPSAKAELMGLLQGMDPQPAVVDPQGHWLLGACGLRTVHPVPKPAAAPWDVTYVSHFPVFGMTISEVPDAGGTIPVGGWTQLVSVQVGAELQPGSLLAYERDAGALELLEWTLNGDLASVGRVTGQRKTWSHVAPGVFSLGNGGMLLYDRSQGQAQLYKLGGQAVVTSLGTIISGLRKTWTHVVAFDYGRTSPSLTLFYEREKGEAEVHTTDGAGKLTLLKSHTGLKTTWTHIAALATPAGYSELLFYDAQAGVAEVRTPTAQGDLVLDRSFSGLRKGATQLATGYFGGDQKGDGFVLYDPSAGEAEARDNQGALLGVQPNLRKTWSQITGGQFIGGEVSELTAYERATGRAELWSTDQAGSQSMEGETSGWPRSAAQGVEARYHAPGDPGSNVVLAAGLASALAAWQAAGGTAWTALSDTQANAQWSQAATQAQNAPALRAFRKADLPALTDPQAVVTKLGTLPKELVDTVQLSSAQSQAIVGGADVDAAAADLRTIAALLKAERLTSLLPLVTSAGEVLLVVGAMPLPVAGINLFEAISSSFRWYVVPLEGDTGEVRAVGASTQVVPNGEGLFALVALGYARRGLTDPYEFEVGLPPGALLTLEQYEFLMNFLDHAYPAGVRVNTWAIRQNHVDLKGDGSVSTLDPTISRTYRAFRRNRHRGERSVTLDSE
jgi:hypothetical protein